jgi:hypothetical protein
MDTRDPPPGSAAAQQQQAKPTAHDMVNDARKQGVPAFEFPPDASPEDKAAAAKKVRSPCGMFILVLPAVSNGVSEFYRYFETDKSTIGNTTWTRFVKG